MSRENEYTAIYTFSFTKQAICCHSAYLFMGKTLSYEKQLLCNSKCGFLEKMGCGGIYR